MENLIGDVYIYIYIYINYNQQLDGIPKLGGGQTLINLDLCSQYTDSIYWVNGHSTCTALIIAHLIM